MATLHHPVLASLLAATLLGACAQTTADPCASANAPVSFGMLLSNTASGNYEACIDTMREDLAVAKLRARSLETRAAQLRADERRLSGERAAAARRLAEMNERQVETVASIESTNRSQAVERQRLEALLAEERRLTDEIERLNNRGGATASESAEIRQQQDRLRKQMRSVLG